MPRLLAWLVTLLTAAAACAGTPGEGRSPEAAAPAQEMEASESAEPRAQTGSVERSSSSESQASARAASTKPVPGRADYERFGARMREEVEERWDERILEPNYLPFMLHRLPAAEPGASDVLVFCRWPNEMMPLAVYIEPPVISADVQDEFDPVEPAAYVEAVASALEVWGRHLEGLVRFRRVASDAEAALVLSIRGAPGPATEPGYKGLGRTEAIVQACSRFGTAPDTGQPRVRFSVPKLEIYVADEVGLLTPKQVEGVALHEIGHALGMKGHSPVPVDLMYPVPTDRIYGAGHDPTLSEGLSLQDRNSFISLYRIPNGSVYARVSELESAPRAPGRPEGPPELALAPHVDAREGFELRVPRGWLRVESAYGLYTANGPIWDHDASMEIFFWPHPGIEEYLGRFGAELLQGARVRHQGKVAIDGREGLQLVAEAPGEGVIKEFVFVEMPDERLMIILCESPVETAWEWRPWFLESLATLDIWEPRGSGLGRAGAARGAK